MTHQIEKIATFHYIGRRVSAPDDFSNYLLNAIKKNKRGIVIDSGYKAYDIVASYAHESINPLVGRVKYILDPPSKMIQENKDYIKHLLRDNYIVVITTNGLDTNTKRRLLKAMFESVIELDITNELSMDFVLGYNTFHKCFTKEHSDKLKNSYIERFHKQNIQQNHYEEVEFLS
jgi:hypothetical protein